MMRPCVVPVLGFMCLRRLVLTTPVGAASFPR